MTSTTASRTSYAPQLELPGQSSVADGPLDMTAMYFMHHAFRRDLADFAAAVTLTPLDARDTWRALRDRWAFFSLVLHHHHEAEDEVLWPALLRHVRAAGDQAAVETLEAMQDEHAEIDPLLEGCAKGFASLAIHGGEEVRTALAARLVATRASLGRHLAHEETEALVLVQRHLAEAEWHALDEAAKGAYSFREIAMLVPWAIKGLGPEHRSRVFRTAGRSFQVLWLFTRGTFRRKDREAFPVR